MNEKYVDLCFDAAKIIFGGVVITPVVMGGEDVFITTIAGGVASGLAIAAGILINKYNSKNQKK